MAGVILECRNPECPVRFFNRSSRECPGCGRRGHVASLSLMDAVVEQLRRDRKH